jgi:hypothetical protein
LITRFYNIIKEKSSNCRQHIGRGETLKKKRNLSNKEVNEIVKKIDQDNWSLANAVRSVVSGGFHKNEIENIKIKNVLQNNTVVSKIDPFLPKTKKTYSSMPIILDDESKGIIEDHIKKLGEEEFNVSGDSPLFPDISTKKPYNTKTLGRHFKKYFGDITFDDLRAYGYHRKEKKLKELPISASKREEELKKFSRHSRIGTTKKLISGDVEKAGKTKKEELPWERIVKSIENLSTRNHKKGILEEDLKNIQENISEIKESDVRESLGRLLKEYIGRYTANISTKKDMDKKESKMEIDPAHLTNLLKK